MIANNIVLLLGLAPPVIELSAALAKSTGGGARAGAISAGEYTPPPPRFMMSSRPDLAGAGLPLLSELTSARRSALLETGPASKLARSGAGAAPPPGAPVSELSEKRTEFSLRAPVNLS